MPQTEAADFYQCCEMKKWKTKNGIAMIKWKDFAYRWRGTKSAIIIQQVYSLRILK